MSKDKFNRRDSWPSRGRQERVSNNRISKIASRENDFITRIYQILNLTGAKDKVKKIFSAKSQKGLRINPLLVTTATEVIDIGNELSKQGIAVTHLPWYPDGFVIPADAVPTVMTLPMSNNGLVFVQNPSSFLPILALDPEQGEKYLDVCSAPGGKAALYAGLTKGKSALYLVDNNPFRVNKKMREVLGSQKVTPEKIIVADARHLIRQQLVAADSFDKVLVDADCSSEGKINFQSKDPLKQWICKTANQFSNLQTKLLSVGYSALKPGGTLVYSTCTLAPEENEGVINQFLKDTPDAIVQKLEFSGQKVCAPITKWAGKQFSPEVEKTLRIDPRDPYMEGFFVSRIVKPLAVSDSVEGMANKCKNEDFAKKIVSLAELGLKHSLLKQSII